VVLAVEAAAPAADGGDIAAAAMIWTKEEDAAERVDWNDSNKNASVWHYRFDDQK